MPTVRKLLKLSGAAVVGTAVAAIFAAPAFAWSADVDAHGKCADNGTVTVSWTLHNAEKHAPATYEVTAHTPAGTQLDSSSGNVGGDESVTIVEKGVPSDTEATITIHVVWSDKHGNVLDQKDVNGEFHGKTCEQPSPSPSASPSVSPSTGGGGGGEGTPTPSSTPAPPSLPVTGPNAAIYGGGAAALMVAGGTLFLVARRRRIRFEA
jgi:LPXTG cell wall anchor motif